MAEGSPKSLDHLPKGVQRLLLRFRERLRETLGENLVGIYFVGSIAFAGFVPDRVDLDFQVVVRRALTADELAAIRDMHRLLVGEYRYGEHLDGFYLPLAKAQDTARPGNLIGVGGEHVRTSVSDDSWALHREHVQQGAVLVLEGPDPWTLYPPATWPEIARALEGERRFIEAHLEHYPFYCVLNLCRLVYTWETKDVAVSKVAAADWGLKTLPRRWRPLIRSALRAYRMEDDETDLKRLREGVSPFYQYATERIALSAGEGGDT
ncbi:MAG: aminoglycoside adenylyltransferase domain-containing protein [Thermoplasmata archaeon]